MTVFFVLFCFVCYARQHITPALLLDNKKQISKPNHTHIRIKDKVIKQVFCQVGIQDLVRGPQLTRLKVADIVEQRYVSEVSYLQPGSRACLRALAAFGFLMLKYVFSHILETLFL